MKYNTPELLLVGAAQNFVLGSSNFKAEDENRDEVTCPNPTYSLNQPDECQW